MATENEKVARQARIACEKWMGYFKQNIDLYHTMHEFVLGQQWTEREEDDMVKTFRKVPMTSNKLGTMANSLLGEQQQNTPQIQVVPMTGCDEETAHLREIITKDIIFSGGATVAYQVAAAQAAVGGFGAFCLGTDYIHIKSFDQDIVYYHFKDATRCYWDVGAEEVNKTDGMSCGYLSRMTRTKFRSIYGKNIEESILKTTGITQTEEEIALAVQPDESENPFNWADDEAITIMDHYVRKYRKDTLYKLSNGDVINQEEMDAMVEHSKRVNERHAQMQQQQMMMQQLQKMQQLNAPQQQPGMDMQEGQQGQMPPQEQQMPPDGFGVTGDHDILPSDKGMEPNGFKLPQPIEQQPEEEVMMLWDGDEAVRIAEKRDTKRHRIVHYRIAGNYILDETEFPSERLPLVYVDQNSYYDKTGKQITRSFFGDCRDTQRYINYLRTQSAYMLKVSRYDQWIGSKKNVASLDTQRNWRDPEAIQGMLTYDESPTGIKPEQVRPPELSQSLFQQYQLAIEDLYTSTGLYPARMGNNGDEASGKAIDARTRQGSYSTYVFFNSINRAVETGGKIVNEMIPKVYDTERVLALMMPDEGMKNVTVNRQMDEYGEQIENDIRKGTYEVRLKPGASYEGQKQEALQSLQQIIQVDPQAFALIADLYAENLPLMNTIEIKNRLKTLVSPQIIEAGKTGKMPPPQNAQPSPEQIAAQADAQYKQAQIQIKQQELQIKQQEMQAEIEIEKMKLEIAQMELAGTVEEQRMRYLAETDRTQSDNAIAHADNLVKILTHKVS